MIRSFVKPKHHDQLSNFRPSLASVPFARGIIQHFQPCASLNARFFSDFFRERDKAELGAIIEDINTDWRYSLTHRRWKVPLERKLAARARREQRKAEWTPPAPEPPKLVIHNPLKDLVLPTPSDEMFAIVMVGGFQKKVLVDDVVVTDWLHDYRIGDSLVFDQVLLIGTKDYTSLGRPYVPHTKVFRFLQGVTEFVDAYIAKELVRAGGGDS